MPGSRNCARCGGLVALATATIEVHPPRANRISRRVPRLWGRFWTFRRTVGHYQAELARPFEQLITRFDDTDFSPGTMLRCIVPGWAHYHRGNRYRAQLFLLIYLALIAPGVLFLGTSLGSVLLGLAFATHVASASDALVGRYATINDRLVFTFCCAAALALVIYLPAGLAGSRYAVPISVNEPILSFAEGDVLWYNPSAEPTLGDVVLYRVPQVQLTGDHTRYILQDRSINRVTATAGQNVRVAGGKLYIDGNLSTWQPPGDTWTTLDAEYQVPPGNLFIAPTGMIPGGARIHPGDVQRLAIVPESSVDGRIFFRSQPLWRASFINGVE